MNSKLISTTDLDKLHQVGYRFTWGDVVERHIIGDITIIEATREGETHFHVYVAGKDCNHSDSTLDGAILLALGYKYNGLNSQFASFAARMLGMGDE